jgi:hypothetical protein
MHPSLKWFMATAIPLGIFAGTALSASAGQVRIELLDVKCGNTEDVTGADEFYIAGALSDGNNTQAALTAPFDINDGQTRYFNPTQQVIFDAYVPEWATVRGGLKAFDEDFGKDWSHYGPVVNQMTDVVVAALAGSGDPYAVTASQILNYGVKGFNFFAARDKDDELGKLELNIPASGPNVEEKTWHFQRKASWWNPGYSTWNYTVRYRITRF